MTNPIKPNVKNGGFSLEILPNPLQENWPFEISFCGWRTGIEDWHYERMNTVFWRLYWNSNQGPVIFLPGGHSLAMNEKYCYLIPPYFEFSTRQNSVFSQFYIHFNFSDSVKAVGDRVYSIPCDDSIRGYVQEFISGLSSDDNHLRCDIISHTLLGDVLLKMKDGPIIRKLPSNRQILRCVKYISEHLESNLDNNRLAIVAGMARNSFIRLFTETMEESPQVFVRRKRIERACQILNTSNLTIKEIANSLGFADKSHFSKVFKKLYRRTPKEYRDIHKRNYQENAFVE